MKNTTLKAAAAFGLGGPPSSGEGAAAQESVAKAPLAMRPSNSPNQLNYVGLRPPRVVPLLLAPRLLQLRTWPNHSRQVAEVE